MTPSTFTWLDYSEHERRKYDEIIRTFAEKDTRDELGLGSVRDAFADKLFPGASTIQTRARYFLFVPWIYCEVERLRERPAFAGDATLVVRGRVVAQADCLVPQVFVANYRPGLEEI